MKKNKKVLMFLTINLLAVSFAEPNGVGKVKYQELYNNMIRNINTEKSNKDNYKLIEQILNKRNKEIIDLYLQSNYIVKPEYLEWQIFFNTFYSNSKGSNNSNSDGGLGYVPTESKTLDLGFNIPIKEIESIDINTNTDFNILKPVSPNISFSGFNTKVLNIQTPELFTFNAVIPTIPGVSTSDVNPYVASLDSYNNFSGTVTVLGTDVNITGSHSVGSRNVIAAYLGGSGTAYNADAGTILTVDRDRQRAITIDSSTNKTFTNNGIIELVNENTAGLEIQSGSGVGTVINEVINTGTINGQGDKQSAFIFTPESGQDSKAIIKFTNDATGKVQLDGNDSSAFIATGTSGYEYIIQALNQGEITLNGTGSFGMALGKNGNLDLGSELLNTGTININGSNSGGISIQSILNSSTLNTGEINIVGTGSNTSFGIYSEITNELFNEGSININDSENSIGIRADGGNLTNNTPGNIIINGGNNNAGMIAKSSGIVTNHGDITIQGGTSNIGAIIEGATGNNDGTMLIEGDTSTGIVVKDNGTFTNTGLLTINGNNSYGLLSDIGTINAGSVQMDLTGSNSVGVYAGNNSTQTTDLSIINVTGGDITLKDGGVDFLAGKNGTINVQNLDFETGQTGLSFYTLDGGKINISNSSGTVKGGPISLDRGTAFLIEGSGASTTIVNSSSDLENLLLNSGITITNLNLIMEPGSRVFSLGEASVNLSVVNQIEAGGFSDLTITGNDYMMFMLYKGLLNVDNDSDLDDPNNDYKKVELSNSSITNQMTIKGTGINQLGIAQENGEDGLGSDYAKSVVTLTNNGSIELGGESSIGIYTDNGIIQNNGIIKVTGLDSYGIYGLNGTETTTKTGSLIEVGEQAAGILAVSHKTDPITNLLMKEIFGDGSFKIEHNGLITVNGNNSYGIYADNNDDILTSIIADKIVNLNSGSTIDLSQTTDEGTGVVLNKATLNDSGIIKVGSKGTGIYSKDSSVNLDGSIIDILGDNSYGIVLDGNSTLTSTGSINTVNVNGDNTIVFVATANPGGSYTVGNMLVNGNNSSNLTLAAVKDNSFIYDGYLTGVGSNSVILVGDNSDIGFGINSVIDSSSNGVTGLYSKGKSTENKGSLTLNGDNSIGSYTENGNSLNNNEIILGTSGIGIYNANGTANNLNGKISVGDTGAGIYGEKSFLIKNNALIVGNDSSVGIYSKGDTVGTAILNDGSITLGKNGIGIYATGNMQKSIRNNGNITIGDTTGVSNQVFGIYSETTGNEVVNIGSIKTGNETVGIYGKDNNITSGGNIAVGNSSIGIYSNGGTVDFTSNLTIGDSKSIGVYGINGANITNTSSNIQMGESSYAFVINSGSNLVNKGSITLGNNNIFVYKEGTGLITSNSNSVISSTGSNDIAFYLSNGGSLNNESKIDLSSGIGNIGIYSENGSVQNEGEITVGDSYVVKVGGIVDPVNSMYSVGIYTDNTTLENHGNINGGEKSLGIYSINSQVMGKNYGNITGNSSGIVGMYTENSAGFENYGNITLTGDEVVGMAGKASNKIVNYGNISVSGNSAIGMYGTLDTLVDNEGVIDVSGKDSIGIMAQSGDIINNGTINISNGAKMFAYSNDYTVPSIINAGVIKVDERFDLDGLNLIIKVDKSTLTVPTVEVLSIDSYAPEDIDAGFLISSATNIIAPSFNFGDAPVGIDPSFTQGTNVRVYKFENVFDPTSSGSNSGDLAVKSNSLTFEATPSVNGNGKIDIWMEKINYSEFTQGKWYDGFAKNIESGYQGATGEALELYDKIDLINNVDDLGDMFNQLSGNTYANINKREEDISNVLKNTLELLQSSENNTKENVKIGIIGGKGKRNEDTYGVLDYDYDTYGVLALREIESTYRHKFGYSLGYTRTDFQMDETNDEDQADTIQLGLHNKYDANGWSIKNDLLGRVSFHNVDRDVIWSDNTASSLNSNYNVYGVSSLNELGKDLVISKNAKVIPYIGLELGYMMHPSFEEDGGVESLKVDSNNAYSIKPNLGIRFEGEKAFGKQSSWMLKGNIGIGYEYELGDMNNKEKASLLSIEDGYHELSKVDDEKGTIKTNAYLGIEAYKRYGIYLTGEYGIGQDEQDDYKLGVMLKASF